MESQFKHRLSRMLRSSFRSCRSKDVTNVIETTVSPSDDHHHHHQLFELFSPRPHSFPSICKIRWPEISFQTDNTCIISKKSFPFHRPSFSDKEALLTPPPALPPAALFEGQKCPPVSPISPFNSQNGQTKNRVKKNRRRITKGVRRPRTRSTGMNDFPACSYNGLFSSDDDDDDDDRTTFFSSRSLSSESSQSVRQDSRSSRAFKDVLVEDGKEFETSSAMASPEGKKVENSFAVMKRSNDPYNDFRTSMVEMIIEKNIFAAKDLENLLQCFLNLNSSRHHGVILRVYNEIWEALFNHSS